jgi:hypothetical protein
VKRNVVLGVSTYPNFEKVETLLVGGREYIVYDEDLTNTTPPAEVQNDMLRMRTSWCRTNQCPRQAK